MKTVKEVSELTGVSVRTLRYYDEIDLLKPAEVTEAGYRLYDDNSLKKLRQILFFRELEVPLSEIKAIMKDSESDSRKILEAQKMMLEMKRNRLNGMIELISDVLKGEDKMSFEAFQEEDIQKIISHSLEVMSEEGRKLIVDQYGDIEKFIESVTENFKDEKVCEHLIKIYGSKEKAVKELADSYKCLFKLDNARALLLEVAKDYTGNSQMEEATDRQYGRGITRYIGVAIYRYYGVKV